MLPLLVSCLQMSRVLDEEEQEDDKLRTRFAGKWNRTESKKLTENFRKEIGKYNTFLTSAKSADAQVRGKFESHLPAMQILCSSPVRTDPVEYFSVCDSFMVTWSFECGVRLWACVHTHVL